jgi:hypothetical protein
MSDERERSGSGIFWKQWSVSGACSDEKRSLTSAHQKSDTTTTANQWRSFISEGPPAEIGLRAPWTSTPPGVPAALGTKKS